MYFKRQVGLFRWNARKQQLHVFHSLELSTMHRTMESKNYLTAEEAIEDLRKE